MKYSFNFLINFLLRFTLIIFVLQVKLCLADIPITYILNVQIEMMDGTKIKGFFAGGEYGGCTYNPKIKKYGVEGYDNKLDGKYEPGFHPLEDDFFKNPYFTKRPDPTNTHKDENWKITFYKKIYELDYLPQNKKKLELISIDESLFRLSFIGAVENDRFFINVKDIKRIKILSAKNYTIAHLLVLSQKEIDLLMKKSIAAFAEELDCSGIARVTISIISYNSKFDTPEKLHSLLERFDEIPNFTPKDWIYICTKWDHMIYDFAKKLSSKYLPQDVVILVYTVTD